MLMMKQRVATLLQELPDECSIEDIQYRLYVLTKVMAVSRASRAAVRKMAYSVGRSSLDGLGHVTQVYL